MKSCPTCQSSYPTDYLVCPQDGTALIEQGAWADGSLVIGKYRILNQIGQGGMGVVYKAVHVAFDELRALKVMHLNLMSDESFVKRFRHEARITRRLQHANAVRVDDIEEADDGRPFIVMEYIEGRSLKSLVYEEGALQVTRVCSIAKQVAAALDAAHQLGMIHRDIKPENIVLLGQPPHEQAKVLDFGIAKIKEGRLRETGSMTLTGAGVVVGTPQYMSPEQAAGKRGDDLDGRSDLYSLGVVMYQMLSGELPFHADTTMEMLIAHMQRPPMVLKLVHPNLAIPDPVSNLVMRLLEKNPNQRPANARAFIEELEHAQSAPPPPSVTRVAAPERVYSPEAAARAVRESLDTAMKSGARHPAPRMPEPVVPPTPASERVVARPQPPAPPVVRPAAVARARSSGWKPWTLLGVLVIGVAGVGAWYFLGRRPNVAPQTQTDTATPAGGPTQRPAQNPTDSGATAAPQAGGSDAAGKSETQQPAAPQQTPPSTRPEKASRVPSSKPAPRQQETRREVSPPSEEPNPPTPVVDQRAVKAALAMGNLYYDRGDYDSAIAEFQKGLRADPANSVLQGRIQAARRAKAAEERLRQ
jgi:eukaryotic-like serine/threonine-protein kinase